MIGQVGERGVIDCIRVWTGSQPARLGEFFRDVRLYVGSESQDLTVSSAQLAVDSDDVSNPNVRISEATQNGALTYDNFRHAALYLANRLHEFEFERCRWDEAAFRRMG